MARNDSGMTLMEMLIVIAILGMLLSMVLPVGGRLDNDAKQEETIHLLESIRFALIGAENAYDENGNRVIGGYVGDFGKLPDLIKHDWDTSAGEWSIPKKDGANEPEMTENTSYNDNGMPMVLWTNSIKVDGVSDPVPLAGNGWNGPYMASTRDDYPDDDDLFIHTASSPNSDELEENRKFLLRQGKGRLVDGWGSSLLVYVVSREDGAKKDLYFVSAGADRRIDFGKEDGSDEGPVDTQFSANEDNLIMILTNEQWNLTDQKTAQTMLKLKDLKAAILGRSGRVTDGVSQPNGYAVDMGGLETLMGSYVYKEGDATEKVYKCIRRHKAEQGTDAPSGPEWEHVGDRDDYPYAFKWTFPREYHEKQLQQLVMNSDYIKYDEKYYRCSDTSVGQNPASSPDDWVRDDTFAGQEWVRDYDSGKTYEKEIFTTWSYYEKVSLGAGWRGPYSNYETSPLTDGWGREIRIEMNSPDDGSLRLVSDGPVVNKSDGVTPYTDDDLEILIVRSDYVVPATVEVYATGSEKDPDDNIIRDGVSIDDSDYVCVYTPHNGKLGYIRAKFSQRKHLNPAKDNLEDGEFYFKHSSAHDPGIVAIDENHIEEPGGQYNVVSGKDGPWLPIGWVTVVYRSKEYSKNNNDPNDLSLHYSSPSPITYGANDQKGPPGYQKITIIHPRTSPQIVLGN